MGDRPYGPCQMTALIGYPGESFLKDFNPNECEPFRNMFLNRSEKRFISHLMKIGQKSIRFNKINSKSIRGWNDMD